MVKWAHVRCCMTISNTPAPRRRRHDRSPRRGAIYEPRPVWWGFVMSANLAEPDAQLKPIAALCDGEVSFRTEGWRQLIYMQGLRFYAGGSDRKMDAVLCLNHDNPTYPTKLYLAEQVGVGLNWKETGYLLGRSWYTFSWRDVRANLPPVEILAAHLRALSKGSGA